MQKFEIIGMIKLYEISLCPGLAKFKACKPTQSLSYKIYIILCIKFMLLY